MTSARRDQSNFAGAGSDGPYRDRYRAGRAAPRLVRASLTHLRPARLRQRSANLSKLLRHRSKVRRRADVVRPHPATGRGSRERILSDGERSSSRIPTLSRRFGR